jgi:hypothetical protein
MNWKMTVLTSDNCYMRLQVFWQTIDYYYNYDHCKSLNLQFSGNKELFFIKESNIINHIMSISYLFIKLALVGVKKNAKK